MSIFGSAAFFAGFFPETVVREMMNQNSSGFSRRGPDIITEELVTVLLEKNCFEFKALFDVIYINLRARNAAGGGEEMGGKRGVMHYLQRTAIQGSPTTITRITNVYQQGAKQREPEVHLFRKHFEELEIGDTLVTAKHTVTETDITNFANVSGDNFYAHMDATSLEGTIFEIRVAHGYFVLSKAAGLFVDAKKGPILLNYGIDEARFTKPVYPGMTIGVRLTVKEKTAQEKRTPEDVAKGIVKWLVDVYDETGETVAIATILTMVKKKNQE